MKAVKNILDIFSSVLLALFIVFVILLVGVRFVGLDPHIVLSGSMEPEIMTGSMVYVKPLTREEACDLKEGDQVTYVLDNIGTKVTHKIYEVVGPAYVKDTNGQPLLDSNGMPTVATDDDGYPIVMYTTYGVNNTNPSSPYGYTLDGTPGVGNLASPNVFGRPVFTIPFLGYVAHFVQNPPGRYVTIAVCALLILNLFMGSSDSKKSKKEESDGEDGNTAPDTPPSAEQDTKQE